MRYFKVSGNSIENFYTFDNRLFCFVLFIVAFCVFESLICLTSLSAFDDYFVDIHAWDGRISFCSMGLVF